MSDARRVWLALGSNLGDRLAHLRQAVALLDGGGVAVDHASSVYETPPWGGIKQPDYFNAVVSGVTRLAPPELLLLCKSIEARAGRDFDSPRNSARPIDVDILLIEDETVSAPDLEVPHASMHERAFVLVPLAEIAPDIVHPRLGFSIARLFSELDEEERRGIRYVAAPDWAGLEKV